MRVYQDGEEDTPPGKVCSGLNYFLCKVICSLASTSVDVSDYDLYLFTQDGGMWRLGGFWE